MTRNIADSKVFTISEIAYEITVEFLKSLRVDETATQETDAQKGRKCNIGSLSFASLPTRGFTPFRDQLMIQHLKAGGTVGIICMESEIGFDNIRQSKNEYMKEFERRRKVAEKEGRIKYTPIKPLSPESFDQVQELVNQPADPSPELVNLMKRKIERKC